MTTQIMITLLVGLNVHVIIMAHVIHTFLQSIKTQVGLYAHLWILVITLLVDLNLVIMAHVTPVLNILMNVGYNDFKNDNTVNACDSECSTYGTYNANNTLQHKRMSASNMDINNENNRMSREVDNADKQINGQGNAFSNGSFDIDYELVSNLATVH